MSVIHRVRTNVRDVRTFGFGVLARLVGSAAREGRRPVRLRGVGRVAVRAGDSDMECFRQVFREREYSLHASPAIAARIRERYERTTAAGGVPVIVDGGANVGASALWFAREFPRAAIVAVEPSAANHDLLVRNTRGAGGVVPVRAALGATTGFARALGEDGPGWAVRTERATEAAAGGLPMVTIRDAVARVPGGELFLVKVDIEGFESDLFARDTDWLDEAAAVFVEPHDWMRPGEFTSRNFMKAMAGRPFELMVVGENLAFVRG